jgi:hypothetical protein
MKTIVRQQKKYVCDICRTSYSNKREAEQCERRKREKKAFHLGDIVKAGERRMCNIKNKSFPCSGKIVRIVGPKPADEEYELKWLGGKIERLQSHVYEYEVKYVCICGQTQRDRYYAPELTLKSRKIK